MKKLLIYSAKRMKIGLHDHGLIQIGAYISHIPENNGEKFFIENILPNLFERGFQPVFFDVGANTGQYAIGLRKCFPDAHIYAFEPVKSTYDLLIDNTSNFQIEACNIGFGEQKGEAVIFNEKNNDNTELATLYRDVFDVPDVNDNGITSSQFLMETIDNFCNEKHIKNIQFLKIDVEGHELFVLKGASEMLRHRNVDVIQFEFNAHNVYSRVYLRDFYLLLNDFEIYRIHRGGIISLGAYNSVNEIFLLQNFVAVRKDICHLIDKSFLYSFH